MTALIIALPEEAEGIQGYPIYLSGCGKVNASIATMKAINDGYKSIINFGSAEFQIMLCDIKKIKPIVPSKFKISEILISKKLDTIARQYMSELRSKAIIDIRI